MELVAPPIPPPDFFFHSNCSSPSHLTAPSSHGHHRFPNFFFSAPVSPSSSLPTSPPSASPNNAPTATRNNEDDDQDFEFDFSGHLQRTSLSADELFDGGKIRPLKPPPSPRSKPDGGTRGNKIIQDRRDFGSDSFDRTKKVEQDQQKRGRSGRASSFSYSSQNSVRKGSRSMSPFRNSVDGGDVYDHDLSQPKPTCPPPSSRSNTKSSHASFLSSLSFTKGYRKWRLKDFLLFRSASEGRASGGKDPLGKYSVLSKKTQEEVKDSSFRSTDSSGSVSSRRRGPVSAHELHYTLNRAASEELKKKTVLPYKQLGPLGCLGFNPTVHRLTS